jgi:Na+/H+-dicarboxylate symporter
MHLPSNNILQPKFPKLFFASLLAAIIPFLFGDYYSLGFIQFFYTVAAIIKSLFICILPFLVFFLIAQAIINLNFQAIYLIFILVIFVFTSNLLAIVLGYFIGIWAAPHFGFSNLNFIQLQNLNSLTDFRFPILCQTHIVLIIAVLFASIAVYSKSKPLYKFIKSGRILTDSILSKVFIPLMPVMVFGFACKLNYEGTLSHIDTTLAHVLSLVAICQFLYVISWYYIAAKFHFLKLLVYIKNMLPAMLSAFTTSSSAATMPITIDCTDNNLKENKLSKIIIPISTIIHAPASAFGIVILSLAILHMHNFPQPSLINFIYFAAIFALAKFTVAGIPGGIALVISPLYIFFDPFGTTANVSTNGAFAIMVANFLKKTNLGNNA